MKFELGDGVKFVFNNNKGCVIGRKIFRGDEYFLVRFLKYNADWVLGEHLVQALCECGGKCKKIISGFKESTSDGDDYSGRRLFNLDGIDCLAKEIGAAIGQGDFTIAGPFPNYRIYGNNGVVEIVPAAFCPPNTGYLLSKKTPMR